MNTLILNRMRLAEVDYAGLLGPDTSAILLTGPAALDGACLDAYTEVVVMDDFADSPMVEQRARAIHDRHGLDRIVALSERDVLRAARLRERLGVPGQGVESATAYRDKAGMKQLLRDAGLPLARFAVVRSASCLFDFAAANGYPVVVKPRMEAGSVGVRVLGSRDDLVAYVESEPAFRGDDDAGLLVEEYLPHELYLVDGIAVGGALVWSWVSWMSSMLGHLNCEPLVSRVLPAGDPLVAPLRRLAERAVEALPTPELTIVHAEVFVTPDGRRVVNEIASRVGGAKIDAMLARAFGHGPVEAYLRGVGDPDSPFLPPPQPRRAAGFVMIRPRQGMVVSIPDACPLPGVVEYRRTVAPGAVLPAPASGVASVATLVVDAGDDERLRHGLAEAERWFDAEADFGRAVP